MKNNSAVWSLLMMRSLVVLLAVVTATSVADEPTPAKVRYSMPTPVKPTGQWSGLVLDPSRRDAAPSDHYIANAKDFGRLWRSWAPDKDLPEIDFDNDAVFVFTAIGPNVPGLRAFQSGGRISGTVYQTVKGGPGFGYLIVKFPRKGLAAAFDKNFE